MKILVINLQEVHQKYHIGITARKPDFIEPQQRGLLNKEAVVKFLAKCMHFVGDDDDKDCWNHDGGQFYITGMCTTSSR